MSFADKLKKLSDEAPAAGYVNINFGKLMVEVNVLSWQEIDGVRSPVRVPYKEQAIKEGENIEVTFDVDITEFNPKVDFHYSRNIVMKKSSTDGKFLSDWDKTVLPSLEAVFGANWPAVITDKKGVYVAVENIDSVVPPKEGKKNYGVPRFLGKFKNAAECKAARDAKYGPAAEVVAGDEDGIGVPENVVVQAKTLLGSLGGNMDQLKKMLDGKPFGNYDADAIIAEMG